MFQITRQSPYTTKPLAPRATLYEAILAAKRCHDGPLAFEVKADGTLIATTQERSFSVVYKIQGDKQSLNAVLSATAPVVADEHYEEIMAAAQKWENPANEWDYNLHRLLALTPDRPDLDEMEVL